MRVPKCLGLILVLGLTLAGPVALAEVTDANPTGFTTRNTVETPVDPATVWIALTRDFGLWWDHDHSYFGEEGIFTIDPRLGGAWIEDAGNGRWARHLVVVQADPGKRLRLRGALGPLQGMAVTGALTIDISPGQDGQIITMTYAVGGYAPSGLDELGPAVDGVLNHQLQRLAKYLQE